MCVLELLKPTGELAAVASGFDVIAFSSAPVSWAACYEGHLALLVGASKPLLGRQNGRRAYRPNSASTGCMRLQVNLPHLALSWTGSATSALYTHHGLMTSSAFYAFSVPVRALTCCASSAVVMLQVNPGLVTIDNEGI